LSYSNIWAPSCAWNGSELAVLAPVIVGQKIEYAFIRMNDAGQPTGKEKYLNVPYESRSLPGPLGWESPSYYTFYKNSMIVITP
jgi:hypothetical protein